MVSDNARYKRDQTSKADTNQIKFDKSGWVKKPEPVSQTVFTATNANELVMCPFCLYQAKLSLFFVTIQSGISQGKALCPECKTSMLMKSLWNEWGAKEYAEWVFNYRSSGFWKKCNFQVWSKRLKEIGWSYDFWARYKELKAQFSTDEIFDDADRMARDYGINIKEK